MARAANGFTLSFVDEVEMNRTRASLVDELTHTEGEYVRDLTLAVEMYLKVTRSVVSFFMGGQQLRPSLHLVAHAGESLNQRAYLAIGADFAFAFLRHGSDQELQFSPFGSAKKAPS